MYAISFIKDEITNNWKIITATVVVTLIAKWTLKNLKSINRNQLMQNTIRAIQFLPAGRNIINREITKELEKLSNSIFAHRNPLCPSFPDEGWSNEKIIEIYQSAVAESTKGFDPKKISGGIYALDSEQLEFENKIVGIFQRSNPMHSDLFTTSNQQEAEIVKWCSEIMHGGVGMTTSGGTASILHAMYTYCQLAKNKGVKTPNVVAPDTVHFAFLKAANMFNIELKLVPLDPETQKADAQTLEPYIDANTICLVGSVPCYPYGIMDDIYSLSALAIEKGIGLHVDSCLGGFVAPFCEGIAPFDFLVEGVTSISLDPHKYGRTEKGISVILYRDEELFKHQFFPIVDHKGGMYPSPGFEGSRSGIPIALAHAAILSTGRKKYEKYAEELVIAREKVEEIIRKEIPELDIIGHPKLMVIAMKTKDPSLEGDVEFNMLERGWVCNSLKNPRGFHFCITAENLKDANFVFNFTSDLKDSLKEAKENPKPKLGGIPGAYNKADEFPIEVNEEFLRGYIALTLKADPLKGSVSG